MKVEISRMLSTLEAITPTRKYSRPLLPRASEKAVPARFFIGTLTVTGETFLIPANRRMEWQAFDCMAEDTSDPGPVPDWAVKLAELSHLEFEMPTEIFK